MTPSAISNPTPRRSNSRKARATSAPDPSTSNQRQAGLNSGASPKSGASSGDTPIAGDDRGGACATSVPSVPSDSATGSGRDQA